MDANERIGLDEARWVIDSEDPKGGWILLDLKSGEVLARKDHDGNLLYGKSH